MFAVVLVLVVIILIASSVIAVVVQIHSLAPADESHDREVDEATGTDGSEASTGESGTFLAT